MLCGSLMSLFFLQESAGEAPSPIVYIYGKNIYSVQGLWPKQEKKEGLQEFTHPQLEFISQSWFSPKQNQIHFLEKEVSSLSLITYFSLHCCPHSTIIG
jgi:hypothetical protein